MNHVLCHDGIVLLVAGRTPLQLTEHLMSVVNKRMTKHMQMNTT